MPETEALPDRDLLLKEFEWVREEIRAAIEHRRRLQSGYLLTLAIICGWIVNRAFETRIALQQVDSAVSAARSRPDFALAICAVAALNMMLVLAVSPVRLPVIVMSERLSEIARQLQIPDTSLSQVKMSFTPTVAYWRMIAILVNTGLAYAITFGCLWFAWPAARQSKVIAVAWWIALAITLIVLAGMVFSGPGVRLISRALHHGRDLRRATRIAPDK